MYAILNDYLNDLSELRSEWLKNSNRQIQKSTFSNLPKRKHISWGFVGYDKERKELMTKLSKGNRRLFQITGQGGSGKSALANEICHDILLNYNKQLKFNQFISVSYTHLRAHETS